MTKIALKKLKISNPEELIKTLREIQFLVSNGDLNFIDTGGESWDFHGENIFTGCWPDYFSNKYFDKNQNAHFLLTCDTYHGNCRIKKIRESTSWIKRVFKK